MKPFKIAVSIGHHPAKPGYTHHNISEYSEMAILAGLIINKIQRASHHTFMIGTGELAHKVDDINYLNPDCAVELHLNAGGGHGHETLYCPGSVKGKRLALSVNNQIGVVLNNRNRGVKEGYYRMNRANGPDYFLSITRCPAIITEIYFLDNKEERSKFTGSLTIADRVAERIAVGIINFLNEEK
jgi:N-acetylmuramoyl-L-alanine amidase